MLTKINYRYNVQGILAKKRKADTYAIEDSLYVDIPEISLSDTRLVGLYFERFSFVENNYYARFASLVREYREYNGKLYMPCQTLDRHILTNPIDGKLFPDTREILDKTLSELEKCKNIEPVNYQSAVRGFSVEELENRTLSHIKIINSNNNVEDISHLRKYISDDKAYRENAINELMNNFVFLDGQLYSPVCSPEFCKSSSIDGGIMEDIDIFPYELNKPKIYNLDRKIPFEIYDAYELSSMTQKPSRNLSMVIFDMETFMNNQRAPLGEILFNMVFKENVKKSLDINYAMIPDPIFQYDNFMEHIFTYYEFGPELRLLLQTCHDSNYEYDDVKKAVEFLYANLSKLDLYCIGNNPDLKAETSGARRVCKFSDIKIFSEVHAVHARLPYIEKMLKTDPSMRTNVFFKEGGFNMDLSAVVAKSSLKM